MAHGVLAKGFTRQAFDAIALMRAAHMLFRHGKAKFARRILCLARQNNNPVARESHGVIEDVFEFSGAQQASASGET